MSCSFDDKVQYIRDYLARTRAVLETLPDHAIAEILTAVESVRDGGGQIFLCGNGGSAATASHLANDLGKGASLAGTKKRFRVLALTDNVPWMTALANDLDYSRVFVEPLKNFAREGDLLIAFSGSGQSVNVLEAVRWARREGLVTVGLTGRPGCDLEKLVDHAVCVDSEHMGRLEDAHFVIQHLIGYYFMEKNL